jgi:hypothetical protein
MDDFLARSLQRSFNVGNGLESSDDGRDDTDYFGNLMSTLYDGSDFAYPSRGAYIFSSVVRVSDPYFYPYPPPYPLF